MHRLPTLSEVSLLTLERNWSLTLAVATPFEAEFWIGQSYGDKKGVEYLLAASFADDTLNLSGNHIVGTVPAVLLHDDQIGLEDKLQQRAVRWHRDMVAIFNAMTNKVSVSPTRSEL